jgi:hypothetical protein
LGSLFEIRCNALKFVQKGHGITIPLYSETKQLNTYDEELPMVKNKSAYASSFWIPLY